MRARTIEIFLPDGEPAGVKVAHIRNRNIEATYIPRGKLVDVKKREALHGVGLYVLGGDSEDSAKPRIYLGEAESVYSRLMQHHANKDFWTYAIAVTSNSKHLTKTHVKFLEWLCHQRATEANRCNLENGNVPTKSHVQESVEADLYDNFEDIDLLVSTIGPKLFQKLDNISQASAPAISNTNQLIFAVTGRGGSAKGWYTDEGFVVCNGAVCAKEMTPSFSVNPYKIRQQLIHDGLLVEHNNNLCLTEDFLFSSPSVAASIVVGNSSNGWTMWKLPDGKTLDEVYRQQEAA